MRALSGFDFAFDFVAAHFSAPSVPRLSPMAVPHRGIAATNAFQPLKCGSCACQTVSLACPIGLLCNLAYAAAFFSRAARALSKIEAEEPTQALSDAKAPGYLYA